MTQNETENLERIKQVVLEELANKAAGIGELIAADSLLPQTLFIIPVNTTIVFPGMMAPIILSKKKLIETVEQAMASRGLVGILLTKEDSASSEVVTSSGMYEVGTVARILKKMNTSDGSMTVLTHSLKRFKVKKIVRETPIIVAQVEYLEDNLVPSVELDATSRSVINQVKKLSESNPFFTEELKLAMVNAPSSGALADLVAFALALKREEAQSILETTDVKERFEKLLFHLKHEQELADVQKKINEEVSQKIHKMQKEYFLKEQLRSIRKELGSDTNENGESLSAFDNYKEKIEKVKLSAEAKKIALEELKKFEASPESSPEHQVIRNYLDWMLALPWDEYTEDKLDIKHAQQVLDEDHFGIPKVKQRILEFLAVRKLNPAAAGSVLCLVGPPGVGKTSLGKSIARAMGRNFFRFSLGGMRDEAEIKGHRRTYIGAMPGKLLSSLKRAGSQNPVLLLDEIDKLGSSFQGDPASALLEVLDPEQNNAFLDHYLDVPFDLSKVLFIVTANTTSTIPAPLLDRMEVIELNGYTLEEKQEIATKHVMPKEFAKNGLKKNLVNIPKKTLATLIESYCREPGMRSVQQAIDAIARKVAFKMVENPKLRSVTIHAKDLYDYLGAERFSDHLKPAKTLPGVVTGLAWTALGGKTLTIEASDIPRTIINNPKQVDNNMAFSPIKITGQLGEVMQESASIAFSYVKKKTKNIQTARSFFKDNEIHLHVPAGAVPKDGPSAGITMATALFSLVTHKKIKVGYAMTGELSLVGKVLPVGGIKEKLLAAKRAGVKTVLMPKENKKDLKDLTGAQIKGLNIVLVDHVDEVFKRVF